MNKINSEHAQNEQLHDSLMRTDGSRTAAKMKKVVLLGDSIRLGYCNYSKQYLADTAEVFFPAENCCSTQFMIWKAKGWSQLCPAEEVAAVQFNAGQWDTAHWLYDEEPITSIGEYVKNLGILIRTYRKLYPNAKLIFATTTPMNPANPETENPRTTEQIAEYNAAAVKLMNENGIAVNDLFAIADEWDGTKFIDYCHLTPDGYDILGKATADFIRNAISD